MLPQNYNNEWIQDADSFWNDKDSLVDYLGYVDFDLAMVNDGVTSFDLSMKEEITEAVTVISKRIDELMKVDNQTSFEFMEA